MKLIDAHLHVWDPERFDYAWLDAVPEIRKRQTLEELAADFSPEPDDEVGYVFVQADCAPEQSLAEVDWVTSLAEDGAIRAIVAAAPLEIGGAVVDVLDELTERRLVTGVRRLLQSEAPGFAASPEFLAGARALVDRDLSFDACVSEDQIGDVIALVDAVPDLRIVLDHLGKPDVLTGDFSAWRHSISELAKRPNVWCKLSGLPSMSTVDWTPSQLTPYLDVAAAAFGADRCMFGSDWPASSVQSSFTRWLQMMRDWSASMPSGEAEDILWRSAARFYRISGAAALDGR